MESLAMRNSRVTALAVVTVRYWSTEPVARGESALDAYAASGVYEAAQVPYTIAEPEFPADVGSWTEPDRIGALAGAVADAVSGARRDGRAVLLVGGNCTFMTGVLGGLEDAHGESARVGLVWFDAHGDFNTPETTVTGSLGGMPVAVAAGLAHPGWRERSHIRTPLPPERILLVDARNLDEEEERLIRSHGITVASVGPGFPGVDLRESLGALGERCDILYLHIDADILDASFVPSHRTREADGPGIETVGEAIEAVMATGKVAAFAVVSVCGRPASAHRDMSSGIELVRSGLHAWSRHGAPTPD
jgi:arginase